MWHRTHENKNSRSWEISSSEPRDGPPHEAKTDPQKTAYCKKHAESRQFPAAATTATIAAAAAVAAVVAVTAAAMTAAVAVKTAAAVITATAAAAAVAVTAADAAKAAAVPPRDRALNAAEYATTLDFSAARRGCRTRPCSQTPADRPLQGLRECATAAHKECPGS